MYIFMNQKDKETIWKAFRTYLLKYMYVDNVVILLFLSFDILLRCEKSVCPPSSRYKLFCIIYSDILKIIVINNNI